MGTGSFPDVRCGRGVTLTPHPLLVARSQIELYLYSKGFRGLWEGETYLPVAFCVNWIVAQKIIKRKALASAISPWTKACQTHIASTSKENIFTSFTHQDCFDEGKAFKYLKQKFRQISESKIKKEIFVGPRINDLWTKRVSAQGTQIESCLGSVCSSCWTTSLPNIRHPITGHLLKICYKLS